MKASKVQSNFTQINHALQEQLKGDMNRCRIKFLAQMVLALCKVQTVTFGKLALAFENQGQATASSSLRRIQRFVASYVLDLDLVAGLLMRLVPVKGPYQLAIDRTDWEFGSFKVNILALGIVYDGCAFPILSDQGEKHGRRAKSLVKYGLEFLAEILLNPFKLNKINVFSFLSCT